jgi:hypothetical protein
VAIFPAISRKRSEMLDHCGFFTPKAVPEAHQISTSGAASMNRCSYGDERCAAWPVRHYRTGHTHNRKRWSRPVSRVLYVLRRDSHSSRPDVAVWLQQPTREQRGPRYRSPIWSCSEWGLPCRTTLAPYAVRSYRTLSPLPRTSEDAVRRSALCCTGRQLTLPRSYLALCPVEPGLSSMRLRATRLSGRLRTAF